ncbi:hypothetical protein [Mycoplasmoides alvi]|uniref:hypothetical protein n=1 Tax=Mycoplasmoides alvi TaxID=78580 RepID=UPI00051AB9D1|nr:hypothetical protein [Mycoplasmoides alvi]
MKFLICSKNFKLYENKWTSFAKKYPDIDFIFINDSEDNSFITSNNLNLTFINNNSNVGKVKSFLNYIIKNNVNDWIFMCDDKDEIIDFDSFLNEFKTNKNLNFVYVADNLSKNNKIIGDKFDNANTLKDFYFKQGRVGDKFILIHSNHILKNKEWFNSFLNFKTKIYEVVLLFYYYDLPAIKINPVIKHFYNKDGTSFNNLNDKLTNYEYYIWESHFVLKTNPHLKVVISRLFVLWYLRKHFIKLKEIKFFYKLIYLLFYCFCLFPIVKKIYLKKLNHVINE